MIGSLKDDWRVLKRGKPGHRFGDLYEARRKRLRNPWARGTTVAGGVVVVAIGGVAGLVPGPGGIIVVAAGLALIASEVYVASQALDWCEPRLRRAWRRLRGK